MEFQHLTRQVWPVFYFSLHLQKRLTTVVPSSALTQNGIAIAQIL